MYSDQTMPEDRSRLVVILLLLFLGAFALLAAISYWVLTERYEAATAGNNGAVAAGNYGAVAMSATSLDFGSAWGYGDADLAARRALSECNARSAKPDCAIRLNLSGNCGSMAVSPTRGQSVFASDADKTLAGALALAQCQAGGATDCVVRQSFCGDGS